MNAKLPALEPSPPSKASARATAPEPLDRTGFCFEHAPVPMAMVTGNDHVLRYVNSYFCQLLKKSPAELLGRPFIEFVLEQDECLIILNSVHRTKKACSHTQPERSTPHSLFWSYTMWPLLVKESLVGIMVQLTETTQVHKKTAVMNEALVLGALRQHEFTEVAENLNAQLQIEIAAKEKIATNLAEKARLLDLSHDAIIVLDMAGCIRYWNHGAEELYGWSRAEAMGQISHHLLQTKFPVPMKQLKAELLRTDRWIGELVHLKRDGQPTTVLARKTLDRDSEGKPVAVLENLTDITGRKLAEEAEHRLEVLTASNQKLEQEIVRRQAVEKSLKQNEQYQSELLDQSGQMQEQLRQLSRQILLAQEDERKRISRELHDVIAQTLTGINIRLAALKKEAATNTRHFDRDIARTQKLVEKSVNIVHEFARELRPAVLDDLGLIPALHSFVKLFSKRTHLHVHLTAFAGVEALDINKRTILYRVAQEALTNVSRHAKASRVDINIQKLAHGVGMKIHDNGKSFSVEQRSQAKGRKRLGLLGMKERIEMVGGTFCVESAPGEGTTIQVEIPFAKLCPPPPQKKSSQEKTLKRP
jgi:PAS domain S-box-containing protein